MKVAYVTPYYNGVCDGRFGRFHDWIHTSRNADDPPFDFDVYAFTTSNADETITTDAHRFIGEATDLWGTKWNKPEFLLNAPRIWSALQNGEYDLIHVLVMDTIVMPTVLATNPDVPLVVGPDVAGWSPIRKGSFAEESSIERAKNRFKFGLKNLLGRTVPYDRAIAFSEHHRNILSTFSIPTSRTSVIHGGVSKRFSPAAKPSKSNDPPEILWVGDFSEHKGYPIFLEAIAGIDEAFVARLVGAGDPNRPRIQELGLADNVIVEEFIPRGELPAYYQHADLHVVASVDETAGPNTQIESLASGTPVVLSDAPSVNEYAPDEAAVYFWPREPDELRSSLEDALADLESLTDAAMTAATEYHADRTLEDLYEIYREVLVENR